jgi:hypothetical protein
MFWYIYIISVAYCLWRIIKSYNKAFGNSQIGPTPGLDTLVVIVFAPVLAIVDVSLTWIRLAKEAEESRINKNKFL